MSRAIVHVLNSPTELFEYARWDWREDNEFAKRSNSWEEYEKTEGYSEFNGNQDKVYEKFVKHNVKNEASLTNEIVSDLKSLDFEDVKWVFAQRLTEGDSVDVNRFLDGQERCWNGVRKQSKTKKVVRVYTMIGGNCNRTPEELAVNGAMAVTLCELLESTGVGVEMFGVEYITRISEDRTLDLLNLIKIKEANEFADLGIINYITGDAHVFRNTMFRQWCRKMHECGHDTACGLGHSCDISKEELEGYDDGQANGIILIPHTYEIEDAKAWLKKTISGLRESVK